MTGLLELPDAVITDVINLISAQDWGSLSCGSKCLLDNVLEHTPAVTLRVDGSSSLSPLGPSVRSRPPHALQAAQRKSKSTLKLCLKIWGRSTQDEAVAAAMRLAERRTEKGTHSVACTSVCTLEIKVGILFGVTQNAAGQLEDAKPRTSICCRGVHMPGHRRHPSWSVEVAAG
jgi:hypothetical protein